VSVTQLEVLAGRQYNIPLYVAATREIADRQQWRYGVRSFVCIRVEYSSAQLPRFDKNPASTCLCRAADQVSSVRQVNCYSRSADFIIFFGRLLKASFV